MRVLRSSLLCALVLVGCGEDPLLPGRVELTQGEEADVWSAAPPVTQIEIIEVKSSGEREPFVTLEPPASREETAGFDLAGDDVSQFEVRGLDAGDQLQALGLSWAFDPGGLAGFAVSLFVGRVGRFGRAPGGFARPQRADAKVASLAGRYVIAMGATSTDELALDGYDLGIWGTAALADMPCPSQPCEVRSLAVANDTIVLAIADDWAITVNLGASTASRASELPLPSELAAWSDVAGGASVTAPDGTAYVVGATRTGAPTRSVIRVAPDGETRALELTAPRAGAGASWVTGLGLVVSGGSDTAAGVELLADGASTFTALPFPPDPVSGAALVPLDGDEGSPALRVGGRDAGGFAPTVTLDLRCSVDCATVAQGDPLAIDRVSAYALQDGALLAIGSDAAGTTRALRVVGDATTEVPLRQPRRGASAMRTSLGHVAVIGGVLEDGSDATSIELYTPGCLAAGCP